MREFAFVTVDVFTDRRFGGNQLAVITDARGLATAEMQAIAAEFGYAETTFVLPPQDPAHTAQVRIFTPARELGFAGHPNVGTAFVLAQAGTVFGRPVGATAVFEEGAGLVPVEIARDGGKVVGATLTAPQALTRGPSLDVAIVAACAGVSATDVVVTRHAPVAASVGNPFAFAELRDLAALERATPDVGAFRDRFPNDAAVGLHLYVPTGPGTIRCRMFAPLSGVTEDAATGSANVTLAALLADLAPEPDAVLEFDIRQGIEMGRPSLLRGTAVKRGGRVVEARIGGGCVGVMNGQIRLD